MLVAGAQHRLGDGEIVPAVGDLGIDCQGALVLRYSFRGTVGVEKNLAAVEVDDGKVGVEPFGDGQRLEGFRPLALFGVDLGDLGEDLRSGIEGCRLAEFGEGHLGLMQRVEGESPIVKQIGGGRLQFGGLLEFDDGEIVAALLEVGEGELEVAADFVGGFEDGIAPEENGVAPHLRAGVGGQGRGHQQGSGAGGQGLRFDLQAADQIDGNQDEAEDRKVHAAIGDGVLDGQDAGSGGEENEEDEVAVAGQGEAAAVVPGGGGQGQQSGEAEDGAVIQDAVRDGKVPIQGEIDGQHEVEQIGEDGAELGEEVLIPGEVLHGEAGVAVPSANDHPPEERHAGGGTQREEDIEPPVGEGGAQRAFGVPPEIG